MPRGRAGTPRRECPISVSASSRPTAPHVRGSSPPRTARFGRLLSCRSALRGPLKGCSPKWSRRIARSRRARHELLVLPMVSPSWQLRPRRGGAPRQRTRRPRPWRGPFTSAPVPRGLGPRAGLIRRTDFLIRKNNADIRLNRWFSIVGAQPGKVNVRFRNAARDGRPAGGPVRRHPLCHDSGPPFRFPRKGTDRSRFRLRREKQPPGKAGAP